MTDNANETSAFDKFLDTADYIVEIVGSCLLCFILIESILFAYAGAITILLTMIMAFIPPAREIMTQCFGIEQARFVIITIDFGLHIIAIVEGFK